MCYLSFQAASAAACVCCVVVLLESSCCGPASWVLSGGFLRAHRDFSWKKVCHRRITAATDAQRHVC